VTGRHTDRQTEHSYTRDFISAQCHALRCTDNKISNINDKISHYLLCVSNSFVSLPRREMNRLVCFLLHGSNYLTVTALYRIPSVCPACSVSVYPVLNRSFPTCCWRRKLCRLTDCVLVMLAGG